MDMAKPSVGTGIDVTDQDLQPHVQMVHKLQKAVAHFNASRQRLQQQEASSTPSRESINHDESDDKIMEAREQRSQIAIIQMAPPAQGSSSSKSSNASTPFVGSSNETVTVPTAINDTDSDPKSQEPVAPAASVTATASGGSQKQEAKNSKKKRHQCSVQGCTYNTPHTKDLARHMRKHTGEKPFKCHRCIKKFTRYDKLVQHIRTHEGHRPFACHVCNYAATDSSSLKKHHRTHTDERPYKCQLCSYSSKDASQLVVHLRRHTGDCPYACTFEGCDAAFKTPSDLSRHTRLHTGQKPYKCTYCDYRAAVKCNLNAHIKRHTNPGQSKGKAKTVTPVVIEEEESTLETGPDDSMQYDSLPFQYACKICDFKADSIDQFTSHMKDTHETSSTNKTKPSGRSGVAKKPRNFMEEKGFQCTNCTAAFVCEESLRCHMRQHATVPNRPANVAPEIYSPPPTVQTCVVSSQEQDINFVENATSHANDYNLHELHRVPLPQSVITENPSVINYNVPIHHPQYHTHFDAFPVVADQHVRYSGAYDPPENHTVYRNSANLVEYHQLHDTS